MNMVLTYLNNNWRRLGLDQVGFPGQLASLMLTPGFQASSHLIMFVLMGEPPRPIFLVKIPRLSGDHGRLDKEAANLQKLQQLREGGFTSIPSVVAYEEYGDHRLLVETVVKGQAMRPALVRKQPDICLRAVLNWLIELHTATAISNQHFENWFKNLGETSLDILENSFPLIPEEQKTIEKTRALIEPLRSRRFPLVFEHGDFSSPNILIEEDSRLGVVDWELAKPHGLPGSDLFFVLTYVAFARRRATARKRQLKAFQEAFFHPGGWTLPYMMNYWEKLKISPDLVKPLFVLSWTNYVANMIVRLRGDENPGCALSQKTIDWLRENRYYLIWQYSVRHIDRFLEKVVQQ